MLIVNRYEYLTKGCLQAYSLCQACAEVRSAYAASLLQVWHEVEDEVDCQWVVFDHRKGRRYMKRKERNTNTSLMNKAL